MANTLFNSGAKYTEVTILPGKWPPMCLEGLLNAPVNLVVNWRPCKMTKASNGV